jgi:hypothetical protein
VYVPAFIQVKSAPISQGRSSVLVGILLPLARRRILLKMLRSKLESVGGLKLSGGKGKLRGENLRVV